MIMFYYISGSWSLLKYLKWLQSFCKWGWLGLGRLSKMDSSLIRLVLAWDDLNGWGLEGLGSGWASLQKAILLG